jgi:dihydrofolate reductase
LIVSLIAAIDINGGIGKDGRLPWHLRADLQRFKLLTMGHYLVMGRKTFESIGKPLSGRKMIIVTRNKSYHPDNCLVVNSIEHAIDLAERHLETEVFIIGGGEVFKQSMVLADKIYLTNVNTDANADVFFPKIDLTKWELINCEEIPQDDQNEYAAEFSIFIKSKKIENCLIN